MSRPKLLELFCCGGGSAMGYSRAGYAVYGVDNDPKRLRDFPFPYYVGDAIDVMARLLAGEGITFSNGETLYLRDFAAIHASPPCQGYSIMNNLPWIRSRTYPLLILPVRELLEQTGLPYVIENVAGARFGAKGLVARGLQEHGLKAGWLCGGMFGLPIYRHRYFETNWFWPQPGHPKHTRAQHTSPYGAAATPGQRGVHGSHGGTHPNPVNSGWRPGHDGQGVAVIDARRRPHLTERAIGTNGADYHNGAQAVGAAVGHAAGWRVAAEAMGIDWMRRSELTQAIPPCMTEYLGEWMLKVNG